MLRGVVSFIGTECNTAAACSRRDHGFGSFAFGPSRRIVVRTSTIRPFLFSSADGPYSRAAMPGRWTCNTAGRPGP